MTHDPHQDSHEEQSNLLGECGKAILWALVLAFAMTVMIVAGSWLWSLYQ